MGEHTYVESIPKRNHNNPFLRLKRGGVTDIMRLDRWNGIEVGDQVIVVNSGKKILLTCKLLYGTVKYIVRIINNCELQDKIAYFIVDYRDILPATVIIDRKIIPVKHFSLAKNSVLISASVGDFFTFFGDQIDEYLLLKTNVSKNSDLGHFQYTICVPECASNIDTSRIPRKLHVSEKVSVDDDEIDFLHKQGVHIVRTGHIRWEDSWNRENLK